MQTHFSAYGIVINRVLATVVVCFGMYLALAPMVPELVFQFRHSTSGGWLLRQVGWSQKQDQPVPLVVRSETMDEQQLAVLPQDRVVEQNTLIIPSINVSTPILESQTSKVLEQGIWHRPKTSTPDAGSNTVLVGHRFLYTSGAHTFYHLDKLKVGDEIMVFWLKQKYTYIVDSVTITGPASTEIELPTSQPVLTLYTCTPLFSVNKRLVVRAFLKSS